MANGRLCSHAGSMVYVGLPYRHGYYLPAEGYIPFYGAVSNAISCQGGTYIVADQTFWFPGDLGNVEGVIPTVLPYGGVPGTTFAFPDKSLVGWFGEKGIVFGATSGEVQAVMTENIDLTAPVSGFSVVLDSNGYDRVISCGWCVNLENKAATRTDWTLTSASRGYGTAADGIYSLIGGSSPAWSIDFGKIDFGTEQLKHLPIAYLGLVSDDTVTLRVETPTQGAYDYVSRAYDATLQIQRVDVGKGFRANWFNLSLLSDTGVDFALASVSFTAAASTRRI